MNLRDYQQLKREREAAILPPRRLCYACWRPQTYCYCARIRRVALDDLHFAILIHPLEEKRPIATGRMTHLCLENSRLIEGDDFSRDPQVNALLADPAYFPVVLYPGPASLDLSTMTARERRGIFPPGKIPLVLAIDGTWNTAKRTMNKSANLARLPQIRFTPERPSRIRVRHQPEKHCYTTLEAVHETARLLSSTTQAEACDAMLDVLDYMVELQLKFIEPGKRRDEGPRRRRL